MKNSQGSVSGRLRQLISERNTTIQGFADFLGVPKGTLEKYLNSQRLPSAELISALYAKLGVSAHWLLDGVGPIYLGEVARAERSESSHLGGFFVPVSHFTAEASAGHGSLVQDENPDSTYAYSRAFLKRRGLKPDKLAVISVRGDSMVPDLHDGDKILVDCAKVDPAQIKDGQIHVVNFDGDLYVRRIQRLPQNRLMLASSNPVYQPVVVDGTDLGSVRIIGRVVCSSHEW